MNVFILGQSILNNYFSAKFFILKAILTAEQLALSIKRLARQVVENHLQLENTVLIGIQPRGVFMSSRMVEEFKNLVPAENIKCGKLDITFYRDDVRTELKLANTTDIPFNIENKNVVIIDDVLWTGRTIRAALDALLAFGRPAKVELCVLIDRRFTRQLPIQPDYVGRTIDTFAGQKVVVHWQETFGRDEVLLG